MKAIYKQQDILCTVIETYDGHVLLEPHTDDARPHDWFMVHYADSNLILDPTDDEVAGLEP